jgi:hypothetical protein
MKKYFLFAIVPFLLMGIPFNAYAKPKPTVQLSTSFNEADFAPYAKSGTGVIAGQVFAKTVGGDVKYGAGSTVYLNPKLPYIVEFFF